MKKKSFWDLLVELSTINKEQGLEGPDRDALAFTAGLAFLAAHEQERPLALNVLFCAASMRSFEALASFCLRQGAQIDTAALGGLGAGLSGALAGVAESAEPFANSLRTMAWLLKSGANPNAQAGEALAGACAHNQPEAVEFLLKNGSDPCLGGGVAWFSAAWAGLGKTVFSASHRILAARLPNAAEAPCALACGRLARASRAVDIAEARSALDELAIAGRRLADLSPQSAHWTQPGCVLPRALRAALFSSHQKAPTSDDIRLLAFLRFLSTQGLAFERGQAWPLTILTMAAHEKWRRHNPLSRDFLDFSLLGDAAEASRRTAASHDCGEASAAWGRIAFARAERLGLSEAVGAAPRAGSKALAARL